MKVIMRFSALQILFTFLYFSSIGQKSISTRELENIADKYGADSALKIIRPFIDISEIDTSAALYIALKCYNSKNNYLPLAFFSEMGQIIKNETINLKTISALESYSDSFYDSSDKGYEAIVIPDGIFHVLIFQYDPSIIPTLEEAFTFWEQKADSVKNKYPSGIKRFFQRFKGTPPSEQLFSDCKQNSYKLAWTLNKFKVSEFPVERANAIRQQLVPNLRNYDMDRFTYKQYQFKSYTIELKNFYKSIDEIDFDNEPEFVRLKENLEGKGCWKKIITNDKLGLYEIGCQWAPLAGRGKILRIELINKNKLKVTEVQAWIS
jgi:hypothetical protein